MADLCSSASYYLFHNVRVKETLFQVKVITINHFFYLSKQCAVSLSTSNPTIKAAVLGFMLASSSAFQEANTLESRSSLFG